VRIVMMRQPLTQILKWGQRIFFVGAVLTLGYCGFVLWDTWTFQNRESRDFESRLHEGITASGIKVSNPAANSPPDLFAVATGGLIGRLEIPRLGLSVIVIEGEDKTTLRRAAGHVPGTPLPGQVGNVGITGHRDTFFRPLRNIQRNDMITLTTLQGEYRYRVVSTKVVSPDDVAVLDSTGGEFLTLVTCHPFYFVGPAPNRFIVRAARVAGAVI
jgi:sortase A